MTSWWNDKLIKWKVDETISWCNVKLMKCQVDEMSSWWNVKLMKWHQWNVLLKTYKTDQIVTRLNIIDKIWCGWYNKLMKSKLTKCQFDETLSWWNIKLMKCLSSEKWPYRFDDSGPPQIPIVWLLHQKSIGGVLSLLQQWESARVCVCVRERECVCACACVCVRESVCACVCVCVWV